MARNSQNAPNYRRHNSTSSRHELQSSRKLAASTTNLQVDLGGKNQFRPRECRKPRECHVNYDACPAS